MLSSNWSQVASLHLHAETSVTSTLAAYGVTLKKGLTLFLFFSVRVLVLV